MSRIQTPQNLFEISGQAGFALFGLGVNQNPQQLFEANALTSYSRALRNGDLIVVNYQPQHPDEPGRCIFGMIHRDRDANVSVTKLVEVPHDPTALRALLAGVPAALRPEPTQTQPKRERRFPEPSRIADGPTDGLVRTAIAQERDAELKAYYGDTDSGATAASGGDGGSGNGTASADAGDQGGKGKGNRMNLR